MSKEVKTKADSIEKVVREFLRENPDFLDKNTDILETMVLSHNSGKAISLVERQVGVMRDRNKEMRSRLDNMLQTAQDNDLLFEKTKRLVLNLLEAKTLGSLVEAVYDSLGKDYGIEFYSLTLFGDEKKLPRTLARIASTEKANERVGTLIGANRTVCGVLREDEMVFLFGERGRQVGSVAAVPLRYDSLYGILAVGNSDPNFYKSSMGTLFLSYVAEILNRVLPNHLK
ncbi:DUF484 family protein [Porticoccaceae bacterium]|nr:DUF484 family protein [Porticoccaceae bacterium]MDB9805207.1 DUF484 family protein [Porticoccaceae bacterium]MDB9949709.1 DUF484 family protein [Porticoccaceae bacterium]MDC1453961.1 DUF484 family protein [Porticoccaceae bacterium]